jgi:hypothetical protein
VDADLPDLAKQVEAVAGAQPVVEERDVERLRLQRAERLCIGDRDADPGVGPGVAGADELHHQPRVLGRIVHDQETQRFGHRQRAELLPAKDAGDLTPKTTKKPVDRPRRALFQRAAMDGTERRRHGVAVP